MRIAITGATGMIGSKLTQFFLAGGHQVTTITRRRSYQKPQTSVITWDPESNDIGSGKLEDLDIVIHLAGSNVADHWTKEHKKNILNSRVVSTQLLSGHLAKLVSKPKLLICASAIGYYGNHPKDKILEEGSPSGQDFLADVCRQWEEASYPASQANIRVVHMRLGLVLSSTGGALSKMRLPFQLGIGGRLGSGQQMMSWVALEEVPYVVEHLIKNDQIHGGVNVVSPQPVSNAEFTRILGHVMHRPALLPVPAFVIRLLFGKMGQSLLLEGAAVIPKRLLESGYQFRFSDLKETLRCLI